MEPPNASKTRNETMPSALLAIQVADHLRARFEVKRNAKSSNISLATNLLYLRRLMGTFCIIGSASIHDK